MIPAPRRNADFSWECPVCHRPYPRPEVAARCHGPREDPPGVIAPLVRCPELPAFEGRPLALTGWLEAEQAELTVLHRQPNGTLHATRYRFCVPAESLEPTGRFAQVPAAAP